MKQEQVVNSNAFSYTIPMRPVPKARPRFGRGKVFTDPKTTIAERFIKKCLIEQGAQPLDGPLCLKIRFVYQRPKGKEHRGVYFKTTRPDLDNLLKLVKDAGNGLLWKDDNQVCSVFTCKVLEEKDCIEMEVSQL